MALVAGSKHSRTIQNTKIDKNNNNKGCEAVLLYDIGIIQFLQGRATSRDILIHQTVGEHSFHAPETARLGRQLKPTDNISYKILCLLSSHLQLIMHEQRHSFSTDKVVFLKNSQSLCNRERLPWNDFQPGSELSDSRARFRCALFIVIIYEGFGARSKYLRQG